MLRFNAIRIFMPVVVFLGIGYAQTAQLNVSVYNDAGVAQPMLKKAESMAATVLGRAGISVNWEDCSDRATSAYACDHPEDGQFSLRITPDTINSMQASIFGVAFLSADGKGRYADVFYSRVLQLYNDNSVSLPEVLGSVMAHELGHLLLGSNAHSTIGIMQRQWRAIELNQLQRGALLFTTEQAIKMQQRMSTDFDRQGLATEISLGSY